MREQYNPLVQAQPATDRPAIRTETDKLALNVVGNAATGFAAGVAVGALAVVYLLSR